MAMSQSPWPLYHRVFAAQVTNAELYQLVLFMLTVLSFLIIIIIIIILFNIRKLLKCSHCYNVMSTNINKTA